MFMKRIGILIFCFLLFPANAFAASSANYRIESDVIGIGGNSSGSAGYNISDTLGQPVIGLGTSTSYKVQDGFWHTVNFSISLAVDSQNLDLGSVTPGTPITGQTTISVTTDAWGGYDLLASQNHAMTHSDAVTTITDYACAIANPCAWSGNGLGFTLSSGTSVEAKWGASPNHNYAHFPASQTVFHSKGGYVSGVDQTAVRYKLDVPTTQKSGQYSSIITYTAMVKL
jgi:hypothetical protein